MKITLAQLNAQLKPIKRGFWVASDEIFLQQLAADTIRAHAKAQGFNTRQIFYIDANFNWDNVYQQFHNRSLFDDCLLLELHFTHDKFNDADKAALQKLAKEQTESICLFIVSAKIESATQKTKWFNAIIEHLCFLPIWPIAPAQYSTWLKERAGVHQVKLDMSALSQLASLTQGNAWAGDQILQQLALLALNETIQPDLIKELAGNTAQTDLFTFVDVFLTHEPQQILMHLQRLQQQHIEPILIIWAIARELRVLNALLLQIQQGASIHAALQTQHVWPSRQGLLTQACRLFTLQEIQQLIQKLAHIDLQIKGVVPGAPFQSLERLLLC